MIKKLAIVLIAMLALNGLNNTRELNDLQIVSAIGIDVDEEGKYRVSTQIMNTKKKESSGEGDTTNSVTVYEESNTTIQDSIRNMINESPKKLYLAHMKLLVISEAIAKEDIMSAIDFFIRDNEGSHDFMLVIANNCKPEEILNVVDPMESNPTLGMVKEIKAAFRYKGNTEERVLTETLEQLLDNKIDITIASLKIEEGGKQEEKKGDTKEEEEGTSEDKDKNKEKKVTIGPMAYFNNKKMIGYLEEKDNISYNIVRNKLKSTLIQITEGKEQFVAEIISCKSSMKPSFQDNKYHVDLKIQIDCNISEAGKSSIINTTQDIEKYKKLVTEKLQENINTYIQNCKTKYHADLMGFEDLFYRKLNKVYQQHHENFMETYFNQIETAIQVEVKFPNEGGIIKNW